MKTIVTNLSEQRFLNRLDSMCTKYNRFAKGYTELDVFVVKRKHKRFQIGRHLADIPLSRFDGYLSEFIFGKYTVNNFGNVEVSYRFSTPFPLRIPDIIISLAGLPLFLCLLYDAIFNASYQWGGLFITMIFSFIGLFSLLGRSKKNRTVLEEHLCEICLPQK